MVSPLELLDTAIAAGRLEYSSWIPALSDGAVLEAHLEFLVEQIAARDLELFPDLELERLPRPQSAAETNAPGDGLAMYLAEVRQIGAADRAEEFCLARALDLAELVFQRERANPAVARAQRRLAEIQRIRSTLVARTLHLVPATAWRYRNLGVPLLDLIQEGNAAVLHALAKYEWRRGVRFATYARWWIQQAILKNIHCHSRTVRLPVYLNQKLRRIRALNRRAISQDGHELSAEELATRLEEPLCAVLRALRAARTTLSLDQRVGPGEGHSLAETLEDRQAPILPAEPPVGPVLTRRIQQLLAILNPRERLILELRFGLGGRPAKTLEQVARIYHVSRERIRQIQVQALAKLRRPARQHQLAAYL